jgi:hypothetical protein
MAARSQKQQPQQREAGGAPVSFLWGLALLGASLLLVLALISFHEDDVFYSSSGGYAPSGVEGEVQNWIGKSGAYLAMAIGPLFVGRWAAFCLPVIMFLWGWMLMRRMEWQPALQGSVWMLALMIWVSSFIGLAGLLWIGEEEAYLYGAHSGQFGDWAARTLREALGGTGSLIGMVLILIIGLGLSIARFGRRVEATVHTSIDKVSAAKLQDLTIGKTEKSRFRFRLPGFLRKKTEPSVFEASLDDDVSEHIEPEAAPESSNGHSLREPENLGAAVEKPFVRKRTGAGERDAAQMSIAVDDSSGYVFPPLDCFDLPKPGQEGGMSVEEQKKNADLLERSLATFGVQAKLVKINSRGSKLWRMIYHLLFERAGFASSLRFRVKLLWVSRWRTMKRLSYLSAKLWSRLHFRIRARHCL